MRELDEAVSGTGRSGSLQAPEPLNKTLRTPRALWCLNAAADECHMGPMLFIVACSQRFISEILHKEVSALETS